jgi:hypothetical protein
LAFIERKTMPAIRRLTESECEERIDEETIEEALNACVLVIQTKLGVDDGGWASMYWDDGSPMRAQFRELMVNYARSEGERD